MRAIFHEPRTLNYEPEIRSLTLTVKTSQRENRALISA
jgi:hypothetical protein